MLVKKLSGGSSARTSGFGRLLPTAGVRWLTYSGHYQHTMLGSVSDHRHAWSTTPESAITDAKFESSSGWVTIAIPFPIWEFIRHYAVIDLSIADRTDAEIRQFMESEVDRRIQKYLDAEKRRKAIVGLRGILVYGDAGASRERQIARG